ncbi:FadR/GntR family transcriptional regulator [Brevibacterium luteolum]|uniref:HTH gntR-type domain-containing protein n=1 Tax=Brevibacterium luteolum TaxID=199591 RepID=A0A2N6PJA9_9MICO|nr:FCD domain-containing protein [Brevibacterium luteolum]PMB98781.1 hypothetical protein CJ198_05590 [Brevibacterium luteolum]
MSTAAEELARDLRRRIMVGALKPGDALAGERELASEMSVSRTTVRAAMSLLAAEGFVTRKVGRHGGTFVRRPGADTVAASLRHAVASDGLPDVDLAEARLRLEPVCAELAAARRGSEHIDVLNSLQNEMATSLHRSHFLAANAKFHLEIARASRNTVFFSILSGLLHPIRDLTDNKEVVQQDHLRETVRAHEGVLRAIVNGDPVGARDAMHKHMSAHASLVTRARSEHP